MLWTSLTLLGLAIVSWRSTQKYSDPVTQSLGNMSALVFFIFGVATAPLVLRGLMLLGAMMLHPHCLSRIELRRKPTCTGLCFFRSQCGSSLKKSFSMYR